MPPRRRNSDVVDIIIESKRTLSRKLTDDIFEMTEKLNIKYDCPICLSPISCGHCLMSSMQKLKMIYIY